MTVAVVVVVVIVIIVVLRAVTACLCFLFVRHSLNTRSRSRCEQWASGKAGRQTDQADLDLVAAGSRSGRTGASALRNMICVVDVTPCSTSQPFPTSAQALFGRRDALVRGAGCSCSSQTADRFLPLTCPESTGYWQWQSQWQWHSQSQSQWQWQ